MTEALGNFLQVALTLVALSSLAGFGLLRGTVTNLRENLRDARDEISDKDRRLSAAEAEIKRLSEKIVTQAQGIEALGAQIRGEKYWSRLGENLDRHHEEAVTHWQKDERLLELIAKRLEAAEDPSP